MPVRYTYPGVYIDEVTTTVRSIGGAETSIAAFVDVFAQGPVGEPVRVNGMADFDRQFGGFDDYSESSFGVSQFFLNGGRSVVIVRLKTVAGGMGGFGATPGMGDRQAAVAAVAAALSEPDDGTGMYALRNAQSFNLLCLPATAFMAPADRVAVLARAAAFCEEQRAFLIVDPPVDATPAELAASPGAEIEHLSANAALWCPSLSIPDPLEAKRMRTVAPSGTMAGVIARTDRERGVWQAPAGRAAKLQQAKPRFSIDSIENQALSSQGLNGIRSFGSRGALSWGARTLHGSDTAASEWKYVPVRRLAMFIETSLERGLDWAASESNGEPLWAQIRMTVSSFLHDLWRQGAFAGASPDEAYFVQCDRTTTSERDIERGIVSLQVGFAPLKPAEFVILRLQSRTLS